MLMLISSMFCRPDNGLQPKVQGDRKALAVLRRARNPFIGFSQIELSSASVFQPRERIFRRGRIVVEP